MARLPSLLKRVVDVVVGVVAVALLLPVMVLIAVAIRLESPGEPIFRQLRAGLRGKPFVLLKFRTMRADVDAYGPSPQGRDDPRLTKVGRVLRETSLDELPQLFNVLAGDMSLVGPRPLYLREADQWDQRQKRRLLVKPGMTGYAQVYGRGGLPLEEKIEFDLRYVDTQSLLLDAKIMFKTVGAVLVSRGGIYERRYSRQKERETDS